MAFFKNKKVLGLLVGAVLTLVLIISAPIKQSKTTFVTVPTQTYTQQKGYVTMKAKKLEVKATAYAKDPITFTGTVPKVGHTIAVDPKVIPLGSRVYIPEFDKVFVAEDTGSAIKGNKIDIYMNTYEECKQWGIRDLTIYILED